MVDTGTGTLYIIGSFKRMTVDPDFKVRCFTLIRMYIYLLDSRALVPFTGRPVI